MSDSSKLEEVIDALKNCADDAHEQGFNEGVVEGRAQIGREANDLVNKERSKLLDQGREQGRNETRPQIEEAREEGRVMGVAEGTAVGKMHADKRARDAGYRAGAKEAREEGYKAGRGDGYKNGWNDAINSPPSAHKPK